METNYYKYCVVPQCRNSTTTAKNKIFIRVPEGDGRRSKWLLACGLDPTSFTKSSCCHVCEDHFDLKEDMDNYMKFSLMGGQKKMKPHVVPHKFDFCPNNIKRRRGRCKQKKDEVITSQYGLVEASTSWGLVEEESTSSAPIDHVMLIKTEPVEPMFVNVPVNNEISYVNVPKS